MSFCRCLVLTLIQRQLCFCVFFFIRVQQPQPVHGTLISQSNWQAVACWHNHISPPFEGSKKTARISGPEKTLGRLHIISQSTVPHDLRLHNLTPPKTTGWTQNRYFLKHSHVLRTTHTKI